MTKRTFKNDQMNGTRVVTVYVGATIGRQKQVSKSNKRFAYELATPHEVIRQSWPLENLNAFLDEITNKGFVEVA